MIGLIVLPERGAPVSVTGEFTVGSQRGSRKGGFTGGFTKRGVHVNPVNPPGYGPDNTM